MSVQSGPAAVSPAVDLAIQSAMLLVPARQRRQFAADLGELVQALADGRDEDASDIVERYMLGANFATVILRYRARADGRN